MLPNSLFYAINNDGIVNSESGREMRRMTMESEMRIVSGFRKILDA